MEVISFIWNEIVIRPMLNSLVILYAVLFNNFGLSIIFFTIFIRFITLPLMLKQLRQTKAMTSLQPKIKELQQKYSKDKPRLSQETMKLYRESGVNPIGCLGPMIIQLPILIGLYQAIIQIIPGTPESLADLSAKFYAWVPLVNEATPIATTFLWMDLANSAQAERQLWLPILVGASTWMQQKMMTTNSTDSTQAQTNKMMLWMMPLMLGFLTLSFPIGLGLYLLISNIIGIIIQYFVTGWGSLFSFSKPAEIEKPTEAVNTDEKENPTDGTNTSDGQDDRRSNRTSTKGARRKQRRSRNRNR